LAEKGRIGLTLQVFINQQVAESDQQMQTVGILGI